MLHRATIPLPFAMYVRGFSSLILISFQQLSRQELCTLDKVVELEKTKRGFVRRPEMASVELKISLLVRQLRGKIVSISTIQMNQ